MRRVVFIVFLCACAAGGVLADPYPVVQLMEVSVDPGMTMRIDSSGYDGGAWVGVYNLNVKSPGYGPIVGDVPGFCIDIWDYSPGSYQDYYVKPLNEAPDPSAGPMGEARAQYLAALLDARWSNSLTDLEAAALQAAVWEIVDEGNVSAGVGSDPVPANWNVRNITVDGKSPGNFYVGDDAVADLANSWLATLTAASSYTGYLALSSSVDCTHYQDYVVRVPVPAAVLLGMIGLAVAGVRLRKYA